MRYQVKCADGSILGPTRTVEQAMGLASEWERRNPGRFANVEPTPDAGADWAEELARNPGDKLGRR